MLTSSGLEYRRSGRGRPLLLIQGLSASRRHWGVEFTSRLEESFDLVAYDHRGVGRSAFDGKPFTVTDLADDAAEVLTSVGWREALVFGVSMGSLVAQEVALRHPGLVGSLVLGCPTYYDSADDLKPRSVSSSVLGLTGRGDRPTRLRDVFESMVTENFSNQESAWEEYRDASLADPVHPRVTVLQLDALSRHRTSESLAHITVRTMVLHGADDRIVGPTSGERVATMIPGARFELVPGGHLFWLESPELTASRLRSFSASGAFGTKEDRRGADLG